MTKTIVHQTTRSNPQRGAALTAVLIILVIITLLGVTAMRMGITSLALATNSQVVQVLFQSADTGTTEALKTFNQNTSAALDTTGLFAGMAGTRCVTPVAGADFTNFSEGNCDANDANSYLSQRRVTLTQMNYSVTPESDLEGTNTQKNLADQEGSSDPIIQTSILKLYSTAVIPSFGSASTGDINGCLGQVPDDADDSTVVTITDCLTNAGSVFTTHASEYKIKRNF